MEGSVLLGKGGEGKRAAWLFYRPEQGQDPDPILDAQGITQYSEDQMEAMYGQIVANEKTASDKGLDLYYMVAPNKEDVYFDKMPSDIKKVNEKGKTEQFQEWLLQEKGYQNYLYPLDQMKEAGKQHNTYFRQDTHWNSFGAYIGYKNLMQMISKSENLDTDSLDQFLEDVTVTDPADHVVDDEMIDFTDSAGEDLQRFTGIRGIFVDHDPVVSFHDDFEVDENRTPGAGSGTAFIESSCKQAPIDKTLLVISDSYRLAMVQFLEKTYRSCVIMHRADFTQEMLDEYSPDTVVVLTLERYETDGTSIALAS